MTILSFFFFSSKVPEYLHVVLHSIEKHRPVFFPAGLLFAFEKLRMQKNSVFQAAAITDLLLNEKQKKYYYFVE